jgi:hypothetical protein
VVPIVPEAVTGRQLVTYSEMEYTAFCRRFEAASTEAILRNEPNSCVVLVNDISEGVFTIFHLDGAAIAGRDCVRHSVARVGHAAGHADEHAAAGGEDANTVTLEPQFAGEGSARVARGAARLGAARRAAVEAAAALRAGGVHELQGLAVRLRQVEAEFPGHVTGQAKADQLAEADLYVFPSSRESYALTLDHAGARSLMRAEFGRMASADVFLPALQEMAGRRRRSRWHTHLQKQRNGGGRCCIARV